MTDADRALIDKLSDLEIVALTVWGEARSQGWDGMRAVGDVIRNRVKSGQFGRSFREVCLSRYQFSCWTPVGGDANHRRLMDAARALGQANPPESLRIAFIVATEAVAGSRPDSVNGADHYMTRALFDSDPPRWVRGETPVAAVGDHVFFHLA